MSYKWVHNVIKQCAETEKHIANRLHEQFHSIHEGYGVIAEEMFELNTEKKCLDGHFEKIMHILPTDDIDLMRHGCIALEKDALRLACEAVQVAAMSEKMLDYIKSCRKPQEPKTVRVTVGPDGEENIEVTLVGGELKATEVSNGDDRKDTCD